MESQKKNKPKFRPNPGLKLMDQVREVLRYHHYAYRTEQTYGQWILRYIHHFGGKTHPNRLGAKEVERFLSHLATEGQVSSTQRQALNALVFLSRDVLDKPLAAEIAPVCSKRQQRPPTVFTQAEVQRLLYGGSLRLPECIRLRIQDVDFGQTLIFVRGGKDRTTLLPGTCGTSCRRRSRR
jgi:integrase